MSGIGPGGLSLPDVVAIDGKGFWWRLWAEMPFWSMVPTNPDNSPIPQPVEFYRLVPLGFDPRVPGTFGRPPADTTTYQDGAS